MEQEKKRRTNIVYILTDDQGYWALGCNGNTEISTPNLDRLAAEGMRMENFFCTSPVCSPARASLLTGRIPSQHGIHDWLREGNSGEGGVEYLEGMSGFSDYLAASGYTCGVSGKWHMGSSEKPQKSFSHWFVTPGGGGTYLNAPVIKDGKLTTAEGYLTDAITEDAIGFLDAHAGDENPFCLYVAYTAPHAPLVDQHPQRFLDLYEDCPFESCLQDPRHPWMPRNPTEIQFSDRFCAKDRERMTVRDLLMGYYAAISAMDEGVGKIVARLEKLGIRRDTLVCFLSDNGYSCGQHGLWGKGTCTDPVNMYDTSVKVPAIFSHPGKIRPGTVCTALLSGYDLMPTLLDYADVENPNAAKLPGHSFAPILLQQVPENRRESVVVFDELGPVRMIRTHAWKYVRRYPAGPDELYDLKHDPGERFNLLDECRTFYYTEAELKEIVHRLNEQMETWFEEYVDPALDGRNYPVSGRGQLRKIPDPEGLPAFRQRQLEAEYVRGV